MPRNIRRALIALALILPGAGPALAAPPVIQCPAPVQTLEGGGFQATITASDPDNDPVTLRCVNPPTRALFDPPTGIFSWVPSFQQAGNYNVQFQAAAGGETTSCILPVTVLAVDRAPTINCPAPVAVILTDTLRTQFTANDPDKDPLTWSSPNLPHGATLTPTGLLTWATERAGVGTFPIEIDANDGTVSVACTYSVTIATAPLPPIMRSPATVPGAPGTAISFSVSAVSPAGQSVLVSATNLPAGAHFDNSTNIFQWTPAANQGGAYVVTFTATDKSGRTGTSFTQLNIGTSQVQPPVFTQCPGQVNVSELQPILLQFAASDPQGFPLAYSITGLPAGASFLTGFGAFSWTPAVGQAGGYDLVVTASNGAKTATCNVHLAIAAVLPPAFSVCPGNLAGTETQLLQFQVTAADPQGFPLTLSATGLPAGSTFDVVTGIFTWTPAIAQAGTYTVTAKAQSKAGSAQCVTHLTVAAISPGTPVIACPPAAPFTTTERQALSFTVSATDPQNRPVSVQCTNPPPGATFNGVQFDWQPTLTQAGAYSVHFVASNTFHTSFCDVGVTVLNRPNTPPHVACPPSFTTSTNRTVTFAAPATDAEGDAVQYLSRGLPPNATFANGVFTWASADVAVGTYTTTLIASDSELRDSCSVVLDVVPHAGALGILEPVLGHVRDIRPDQGGWLRVTVVAAPTDLTTPVTGYALWRRVEGPDAHALAHAAAPLSAGASHPVLDNARPGALVPAAVAGGLGFPPGTWESVSFTPSLQSLNLLVDVPTRDDSSAAGRPYEVFVATAHTSNAALWGVSLPDSGYSVDDLAPRAPAALVAQASGATVRLAWSGSPDPDLDHYAVERAGAEDFAGAIEALGATHDSSFVDPAPRADAWYRVIAVDVHGNASRSAATAGPRAPAWGAGGVLLSAPRPNPSRGETAFDLTLPADGPAEVAIVDARGAIVRTLAHGLATAGPRTLVWDGKNDAGRTVGSGLYQLRVRAHGVQLARKIVLLR